MGTNSQMHGVITFRLCIIKGKDLVIIYNHDQLVSSRYRDKGEGMRRGGDMRKGWGWGYVEGGRRREEQE